MSPLRRTFTSLAVVVSAAAFASPPVRAVTRDVVREVRDSYEGRSYRLRADLRSAGSAVEPNTVSLGGIGYGREGAPVMFSRLETVFIDRIMSEGAARLSLTIYRSAEEARRLRSGAIPPPVMGGFGAATTLGFARADSTSVVLEMHSPKKDSGAQRQEIEALLRRLFYIDDEPTKDELARFVIDHKLWPIPRLAEVTGLPVAEIKDILLEGPR